MVKAPTTPAARFRAHLLTGSSADASFGDDLEQQDMQKLCKSPGGKLLLKHFESKREWASEKIMETSPSDSDRISFLQAYHFLCSEYLQYLTPEIDDG